MDLKEKKKQKRDIRNSISTFHLQSPFKINPLKTIVVQNGA